MAHPETVGPPAAPALPRGGLGRVREEIRQMRASRLYRRRTLTAYGFISPTLVILLVFILWPMVDALRISFYEYSSFGPSEWVGLANYRNLLDDEAFRNALGNTLYYAAVATPISVGLALGLALLLNTAIQI